MYQGEGDGETTGVGREWDRQGDTCMLREGYSVKG